MEDDDESFEVVGKGGGGGGLLPEDLPPKPPSFHARATDANAAASRDVSALSSMRSYSYGSMEIYEDLVATHLMRSLSDCTYLSDYEIVTVGGTVQHRCQRCTFLNPTSAAICQGCQAGLMAMPAIDEQIAVHLQYKEAQQRAVALRQQGPLAQAQALAQDVMTAVFANSGSSKKTKMVFQTLPDLDLTMSAARFIQVFADNRQANTPQNFTLAYTTAPPSAYESICKQGGFTTTTTTPLRIATHHDVKTSREYLQAPLEDTAWLIACFVPPPPPPTNTVVSMEELHTYEISTPTLPLAHFSSSSTATTVTQLWDALHTALTEFFITLHG